MFYRCLLALDLLCSRPDPDLTFDPLMAHTMLVNTREVFPVIHTDTYSAPVPSLAVMLTGNNVLSSTPYYENLLGCCVTAVYHYHSDKHEFVVAKYALTVDDKTDERYARFERFRVEEWRPTESSTLGSVDQIIGSLVDGERLDSVKISDVLSNKKKDGNILGKSPHKYFLVQSLTDIRPGTLCILDVAVLADSLGLFARQYSTMTHMCIWYACALFVLIRRRLGADARWEKASEKRLSRAGTTNIEFAPWLPRARRRLVDPETAMLVHQDDQKLEKGLRNLCNSLYERGKLSEAEYAKGLEQISIDLELWRSRPDAIDAVGRSAEIMIAQAHSEARVNSDVVHSHVTAKADLVASEAARKVEESKRIAAEAAREAEESKRIAAECRAVAAEHALEDKERENARALEEKERENARALEEKERENARTLQEKEREIAELRAALLAPQRAGR